MINDLLRWWVRQLADLAPATLRASADGADMLVAEMAADWNAASGPAAKLNFIQRRNGRDNLLGQYAPGSEALAGLLAALHRRGQPTLLRLRVPSHLLLEREVVLPLAAETELNNVMRYEMNQLTPFTAEQVYWSATTQRRDARRGKLTLLLLMIPKLPLTPLLGALRDAGLPATAIEVAESSSGSRMRVIGLHERRPEIGWRSRIPEILGVSCASLAVVAVALPFLLQSLRAAALNQEIVRLAPRVQQTEMLRQQLLAAARTGNAVAAARAEVGDPLAVLAAVTQALPNDSFLTELTLNHLQLNIAGQSAAAAALLAALSAYPIMTDVAFSAPVTRDTASRKDLFSIQSRVAPQ